MDTDKFKREEAEMMERLNMHGKPKRHDLQPGEFVCPRCQEYQLDENHRFHPCAKGGIVVSTMYIPNTGKLTKNSDPEYRKHAGSRSYEKRWKTRARIVAQAFNRTDSVMLNYPRGAGKTTLSEFSRRLYGG
jgi:hypothetical protein